MKYFSILLVVFLLSSCCGTKQIVSTPKTIAMSEPVDNSVAENSIPEESQPVEQEVEDTTEELSQSDPNQGIIASEEKFDHQPWNALLQQYVSEQGNVNYKSFKTNRKALTNYIKSLSENMPASHWSSEDILAYWINAYNAMTVDLIVRNYPIKSIKDIDKPWDQRLWKLGNKWYNLDEIEHQLLRKMNEPRIHFGIVCASFSCPKLLNEAFSASKLDAQLTQVTKEFLADPNRNTLSQNSIKISKIFQWFAKDFKQDGSLIDFLNQYSSIQISNNAKKRFASYNWDLNE